jgi:FHS family L-fucose permease-like MFS transporter
MDQEKIANETGTVNVSKSYTIPFITVTILFFMWGFFTVMNDVLIPHLKNVFVLSHYQSMLVQLAFFGAYFIGSLAYFLLSWFFGDPVNKIGYRNGMFLGLLLAAAGSALFFPAALVQRYWFYLAALFVVGLGFVLLQITANPYVAILGPEKTASSRLNLSQGFNSFGTTIGPLIGGFLIFKYFAGNDAVKYPYLVYAGIFLILAIIIRFSNLPQFKNPDMHHRDAGTLKYRHLILGMIAIFVYVGAEVAIGSIMISFIKETVSLPESEASNFVAIYWGGLMIGRFAGALSLSKIGHRVRKYLLMFISMAITFAIIYISIYIKSGTGIGDLLPFLTFIAGLMTSGDVAIWAIVGIGIFNSIMWSNIFTLSIAGLGKYTSQGSSLLVMAILGGAVIPLIQGAVADAIGVHLSFIVPIACYVYIAFYGWKGYNLTP